MRLECRGLTLDLSDYKLDGVIYLYPKEYRCLICNTNVFQVNGPIIFKCKSGHDSSIMDMMRRIGVVSTDD